MKILAFTSRGIRQAITGLFTFVALQLLAVNVYAQLPELASPSAISGLPTTARFFGGNTADGGSSYGSSFAPDQAIDVLAEIQVQADHVNTVGNLYLVVILGTDILIRVESGAYVLWDGSLENLLPATSGKTLQASEPLTVVQNTSFGALGVVDTTLSLFFAYDTQAAPGELYFSGTPLSLTITAEASVAQSLQLFTDTISAPIVQTRCIVCHVSTGIASNTRLVYANSSVVNFQQLNYDTIINYIQNVPDGSNLILSKPQGITHGGGVQLVSGSSEFQLWSNFVTAAQQDISSGGGNGQASQSIFAPVINMDNAETLRKALLLFAGRLPTETEIASVQEGTEDSLRSSIRAAMEGDGFKSFLLESSNNRLLTEAFSDAIFAVVDRFRYPNSAQFFQSPSTRTQRGLTAEAIASEPLQLIAHVAMNERPYTEVLTANYIMVNPYSAEVYGGNAVFTNPTDTDQWRESTDTDYFRCTVCVRNELAQYDIPTVYPHAGILNSPAFLARFPSTETNRNRARARWTYYFFLGVDIEGLSERTTDPAALSDENNPTLNNANCTVCHDIMDPVAGAFQNYGDDGFYRDQPGGLNSLPRSYRNDRDSDFQFGDTWYADMLMPGLGTALAPNADNSLQWLANEIVNDSRFGYGTVNFWYPAVIGREPYPEPENPEDANYQLSLAAYSEEQALMQSVANQFVAGSAGFGPHNLKDLLVDLALSNHFRAASVSEQTDAQAIELDSLGSGRLLSPEQLNRKLFETTGYNWRYGSSDALVEVYGLVYGGIDSFGITERAEELTTLMSTVVTTMANEASCPMVAQDFALPQNQRTLFRDVELTTTPTNNEAAIRRNIQYLHSRFFGEELASNDAEINASYSLFSTILSARLAANKTTAVSTQSELCIFENVDDPITVDSNQTLRSWAALVNYLLRDYKFIHE